MKMKKKMSTALLIGLTLCACHRSTPPSTGSTYKTMIVERQDRALFSEYAATLSGRQMVEIRPQVSGLITRICIDEGQKVQRGQVLFVIDQTPYLAALNEAQANVKNAQAKLSTAQLNLESVQALYEKKVLQDYDLAAARNELASAQAALAQAEAQQTNARNNLSYTEVKSPVDGSTGMIAYRVGALVNSSIPQPLVSVSDDSQVYAYFSLGESEVVDLMEQYGSLERFIAQMPEVELRMANGKTYAEKGRIAAVSGIVTSGMGTVTLRADFPNGKDLLRSGGSGTVVIPSVREKCIVIPQSATYELQDRTFVYKVVDNKAKSVPVTLFRLNNGTEYIVETGLEEGEEIIAEGAGLVREGAAVASQNENE